MTGSTGSESAVPRPSLTGRTRASIGFVVGALLLAAAILAVSRNTAEFRTSIQTASQASWWLIVLALALPVANWLIMSLSLWVLMRRHGRIALGEMCCLIGAAWLLNYLPLRPGLAGRVAYHKVVNRIPVRATVTVTLTSIACAAVSIAVLLAACVACAAAQASEPSQCVVISTVPVACGVAAMAVCRATGGGWWLALAFTLRSLDLLVWTARYAVVFAIVGHPLSWLAAAAIAAIVQVAMLVPLVGNGLGLREWTVGMTSGLLPPGVITSRGTLTTTIGLAADVANRAAEIIVSVPIGAVCSLWIAKRNH